MTIGGGLMRSPAYTADIFGKDRSLLRRMGYDADIVPLPGHTYGSCGILSKGVLYCGDAFTMIFGKPEIPPHAVSPQLMQNSLRVIESLHPDWLACGHGLPVRYDRAAQAIADALTIRYDYR
jgi:glyoxylase-like metal-dependent hydrolase (beta-lactamase superfamily II)